MILLYLGLVMWIGAHLFKRIAPGLRAPMGNAGKAVVAVILVIAVVLMVIGYRGATGAFYWGPSPALVGINNLAMVLAFYSYAAGAPKGPRVWLGTKLRHPQLIGFSLWAAAHLLVNGDMPSFVLFGGLLLWALGEIVLINRLDPLWTPPPWAGPQREVIAAVVTLVVVVAVMVLHNWLGVQPWG